MTACRICQKLKDIPPTKYVSCGEHAYVEIKHDTLNGHVPNGHNRATVVAESQSTKHTVKIVFGCRGDERKFTVEDFKSKFVYLPLIDPLDSM